jgi:hypothetical protein
MHTAIDPLADVQMLLNHFRSLGAVLRTRIDWLEGKLLTTTTTQDTMRVQTLNSANKEYRAWFKDWVYLIQIKKFIEPSRHAEKFRGLGLDALLAELKAAATAQRRRESADARASSRLAPRVPPPTLSRPVYNWTVDVDVGFVPRVRQRHSARAAVPRGRDKYRAHRTKGAKLRAQYKRARANKARDTTAK